MPNGAGLKIIASTRIQRVMRTLLDVRQIPQQLKRLNRTAIVDAFDEEITMRFTNRIIAADVIPDNARAVVGAVNEATLEAVKIPNIKRGAHFTQAYLNILSRLENTQADLPDDEGFLKNRVNATADDLLLGIRQRMEHFLAGMTVNALTYNRLGTQFSVTFGMPSDLQVTPATPWSTAATATPISDIQSIQRTAREVYGQEYNRITLSTTAFNYLVATDEFTEQAQLYFAGLGNTATFDPALVGNNVGLLSSMLGRILGMTIEIDDSQYWEQNQDGSITASRFQPANKVVLSNSNQDNSGAYDMANSIVTESIVGSIANNGHRAFSGPTRGPTAYMTAPTDLNPPEVTVYGVARAFPRLHLQSAFAVLTVY